MNTIDPWQPLWRAYRAQRLPHAILLSGAAETGAMHFADRFSRALLCQAVAADGTHCNHCHMCRLVETKAHPSLLWVEPEKENSAIKVNQIRDVTEFINQTALEGDYRIVIIHPADSMNANAANALLKTLEEPPKGALLILISEQPSRLPATILSRCQKIVFRVPPNTSPVLNEEMMALRQNIFQALYALSQQKADPLKSAAALQSMDALPLLDFMLSWIMDLLRLQVGAETITNNDYESQLIELSARTALQLNTKWMENVMDFRKQLIEGFNLNKQLLLESLFIRWVECTACS